MVGDECLQIPDRIDQVSERLGLRFTERGAPPVRIAIGQAG